MNTEAKSKNLSEEEIDEIVIAQAADDGVWEEPITVQRTNPVSISLPSELVKRAVFLARLHKTLSVEAWLRDVIEQRIDFEEAAYTELKQTMASQTSR